MDLLALPRKRAVSCESSFAGSNEGIFVKQARISLLARLVRAFLFYIFPHKAEKGGIFV